MIPIKAHDTLHLAELTVYYKNSEIIGFATNNKTKTLESFVILAIHAFFYYCHNFRKQLNLANKTSAVTAIEICSKTSTL